MAFVHGTVRVYASALLCSLATCGPASPGPAMDGGETNTGVTTGDEATTTPTGGHASESDETGAPVVCLTPQPDGIPIAGSALECVSPDLFTGALDLVYDDWPEVVLDDCGHGIVELDVACIVATITSDDAGATVGLTCTDDDATSHDLALEISSPALFFPVCTGQSLRLRYKLNVYGCPNGGGSKATVLRDGVTDELLAASFEGRDEPWLDPLHLITVGEAGCPAVGNTCVMEQRYAVQIDDGVSPPAIVYDGTRRLAELGARHVVQTELVAEFSDDGCETFGTYTVALVRVDP